MRGFFAIIDLILLVVAFTLMIVAASQGIDPFEGVLGTLPFVFAALALYGGLHLTIED